MAGAVGSCVLRLQPEWSTSALLGVESERDADYAGHSDGAEIFNGAAEADQTRQGGHSLSRRLGNSQRSQRQNQRQEYNHHASDAELQGSFSFMESNLGSRWIECIE